jgi:hypothetical protein
MKPLYSSFGFTKKEWETFKAEARQIMVETARQRGMITYGQLASAMKSISLDPHDRRLWEIIGDVGRDEEHARRGLLCVVVVHDGDDMEPGNGFFELAKYFKRNTADRQKCFVAELHKVHAVWS